MARRFLNLVATAASMAALIAVTIPTSASLALMGGRVSMIAG